MDLGTSYSPNYFSLHDILATHTRVPVTTKVKFPNLGFLDPSLSTEDLPPESKIELPFWAAKVLTSRNRNYVAPEMPKLYKEAYMEALKADPSVVDLNKLGPHFYQTGLHLTTLDLPDSDDVGDTLPKVLQHRLRALTDTLSYETKVVKLDDDPLTKQGSGIKAHQLDTLEHKMFEDAKKSYSALSNWLEKK